jgi:capsular polysaccharide biosynthesis protein
MSQNGGPSLHTSITKSTADDLFRRIKKIKRKLIVKYSHHFDWLGLSKLQVSQFISASDRKGREVDHYRVIHEAQTLDISTPEQKEFLKTVRDYQNGIIDLHEIFVCEVKPACYYPRSGVLTNENFEVFLDSLFLPHRFYNTPIYRAFKPNKVPFVKGPVSSIERVFAGNFWHWIADCLPQLLLLEKYMGSEPLTLLISNNRAETQRLMLTAMLPKSFRVEFVPPDQWIKTDRFILPSFASGHRHGCLPKGYYAEISQRIRSYLGVPELSGRPDLRVYISRATAGCRRVQNESELVALLESYGFITLFPERLPLKEQIEIFQRAEVIAGPHGGGLGGMVFSKQAKVLVFYPEKTPSEYFYTMAWSSGLQHYGISSGIDCEEDDVQEFMVNLSEVESTLAGPIGITRR